MSNIPFHFELRLQRIYVRTKYERNRLKSVVYIVVRHKYYLEGFLLTEIYVGHQATWSVICRRADVLFMLQPQHKGKTLVEHVCRQLNLIEKDYFGLRYVDGARQRVSACDFYLSLSNLVGISLSILDWSY